MKRISYFAVIILLLTMVSCRQKLGTPSIKVDNFSTGKAGEMILAIDTGYWSASASTRSSRCST